MLTAFDVGVAVLVLISAILATARGFTREILSLATWVGAAAVAAYLYFYQPDLLNPYFADELIGRIVLVGAGFLISLIILHLITMRIADFVVDSRIGPQPARPRNAAGPAAWSAPPARCTPGRSSRSDRHPVRVGAPHRRGELRRRRRRCPSAATR